MKCAECEAEVDSKKLFCPNCRAPLHLDDEILPVRSESPPPVPDEQGEPDEAEVHRRLAKAWIIRISITVLIIGILVLALLLLANARKSPAAVQGSRGQVLNPELSPKSKVNTGIQDSRPDPIVRVLWPSGFEYLGGCVRQIFG